MYSECYRNKCSSYSTEGLPYTIRSFMIVIVAGLGNLPGVAMSGMGLGVFEEFADYILGTEFRIGSVFLLLVLILVYRRFKLSRKREYLKWKKLKLQMILEN